MKELKEKKTRAGKIVGMMLAFAVLMVLSSFIVAAFTIGSPSAINVEPGETKSETFSIMNRGDSAEDIVVEVVVEEGSSYIELVDGGTRYNIPAGGVATVNVRANVPGSASIGDSYPITILFAPVSGGEAEGGTVDLALGYRNSFDINVVAVVEEPPAEEEKVGGGIGGNMVFWIIGIVILIIVVWWVLRNMRKS